MSNTTAPGSTPNELPSSAPRTTSLAATATMNAGLQRETTHEESLSRQISPRSSQISGGSPNLDPKSPSERQRKSIAMNLNLNDPALPAPGELQSSVGASENRSSSRTFTSPPARSPGDRSRSSSIANRQHGRQPSVGEVYQEMEQEQEAQVNRLLQTIRLQSQQLAALQARSDSPHSGNDAPSPTSERRPSLTFATGQHAPAPHSPLATANRSRRQSQTSPPPVRGLPSGFQLSHSLSTDQEAAVLASGQATPALPTPTSSVSGAVRDEVAFYQAECQNLSRENQMLKARIRELERQASTQQSPAINSSAPALSSHLSTEQSVDEGEGNDLAAKGGK